MKLLFFTVFLCTWAGAGALDARLLIHADGDSPSMLFLEGAPLKFRLAEGLNGKEYTVTVKDAFGKHIFSEPFTGDRFSLPPMECGYYRIFLSCPDVKVNGSRGFGIVASRRDVREQERRPSPYSVDLAVYSGCRYRGDSMGGVRILGDICRKLGVGFVRNRLVWSAVEKTRGGRSDALNGYREVASILRNEYGIESSVTFHDAPGWTKLNPKDILPSDLSAVYEFCRMIASEIPDVSVWEFWNEQDDRKAWVYAAAEKAAYLGFKAGNPRVRVTPGSLILIPFTKEAENMFRNGVGDYCDIFNYHLYNTFSKYNSTETSVSELLQRSGIPGIPVWITESGTFSEGPSELKNSVLSKEPVQSCRQEMLWAEFVPKSHILAQANGTERIFTFILRRKQEGTKQWGLLHPDFSVKPGAVALAVLNRELGSAVFEGEINAPQGYAAYLYTQPDGSQTIALWKKSGLDISPEKYLPKESLGKRNPETVSMDSTGKIRRGKAVAPSGLGTIDLFRVSVVDTFGTSERIVRKKDSLSFSAGNYVCYIRGLRGLKADRRKRSFPAAKDRTPVLDRSIVFQAIPGTGPGKLTLNVYNFDRHKKTGRFLTLPARIAGLPETAELPPMGKVSFALSVSRGDCRELEISAEFNGKKCSPLLIPCAELGLYSEESFPEILNTAHWTKNSSGKMAISYDEPEKALVFKSRFTKDSDRWCYPGFNPAKAGMNLKNACGISFEMKEEKALSGNPEKSKPCLCWIDGKRYHLPPSLGKWTKCRVFFPNHPEQIKSISIGLNPRHDNLEFRLRNFKILR